ncbi:WYL domain-containing protein [Aeromonas sp. QDB11]|uniref:WYL domain-containing protein n=1 Tax=Aeromonas sp. QDB11 TaxID=2990482 RepID=UPI003FA4BB2F
MSPVAAPYISRRDIFSEQTLLKAENDGSLLISASITGPEYLFRWLRYWLPEIKIITPQHLAEEFSADLATRVKTGMAYV